MCGVLAFLLSTETENISQRLVDGLTALQHRGQDAAGITTSSTLSGRLNTVKDVGLVREVFTQSKVELLMGQIGLGHVRYPTVDGGKSCLGEAQPLYTNSPWGLSLVHNGHLINTDEIRETMRDERRHINTNSDSELLLNVFAEEMQRKRMGKLSHEDVFDAVRSTMRRCRGGYACAILIHGVGLLAFRDRNGIRPLCFGKNEKADGRTDWMIASESVAISAFDNGYTFVRDVRAGEAIFISVEGHFSTDQCLHGHLTPCIFEYVYFARPDSIIDGISVYHSRLNMGTKLASKIMHDQPDLLIDVVMPIPDTSRTSALQCATMLGKPYREGFTKNRYIARTFIQPGQEVRRKSVRLKLNTIKSEFKDKHVLLIDDSIVRGTTSTEIIAMAREAGAASICFASAAPPVRHPNLYGIDLPTTECLVAHERSVEDIAKCIGADSVVYNDLDSLEAAVREAYMPEDSTQCALEGFDSSCFNGKYVTDSVVAPHIGVSKKRALNNSDI